MNATAPDIRGVIVPLTTPIDKNDKIDLKTLERHINYLIEAGVKTIIANAGTGDYNSLNESERKQIAETAVDIVDGRINVLVGTSACSTRTAIQWSKHAESIGAKGVMVSPPYYDVKSNIDIVSRHFANISDAISIPILIYNHDGTIQGLLNVEEVEKICKVANTPWIKLTTDNIHQIPELHSRLGKDFLCFEGVDQLIYSAGFIGAAGAISGLANAAPKLFLQLWDLIEKKDIEAAHALHLKLHPFLELACSMYNGASIFIAVIKEIQRLKGYEMGATFLPYGSLDDHQKTKVLEICNELQII